MPCTEGMISALIEKKHDPIEWCVFFQVSNATGSRGVTRFADALAFNTWPSRGMEVHGFEIKCSRRDFVSELKNPAKSSAIQQYCDRWWLVIGDDEDIVKPGELPPTWGLMKKNKNDLEVIVQAPKLTPIEISKSFLLAVLRSAKKHEKHRDHAKYLSEESYNKGYEEGKTSLIYENKRFKDELNEIKKSVSDFESKSGVQIGTWNSGNVAEVLRIFLENKDAEYIKKLVSSKLKYAEDEVDKYTKQLQELEGI